jgi:hypothetical protein
VAEKGFGRGAEFGGKIREAVTAVCRVVVALLTDELFNGHPQPIGTGRVAKHNVASIIDGVDREIRCTDKLRKLIRDRSFSGHSAFPAISKTVPIDKNGHYRRIKSLRTCSM